MSIKQDVKLTFIGPNYDISIANNGDIETEDSFEASIMTSLFTDRRADPSEVLEPERRRGWIGSHDKKFKLGSKLWLYSQIRNRQIETISIPDEASNALSHFVSDGLAISIISSMEIIGDKAILSIDITRPNSKVIARHYELWNNTGK